MSALDLIHPSDRTAIRRFLDNTHSEPDGASVERRLLNANGSPVWVLLSASRVRDRRGRPRHCFAQAVDITARHEAERRLALQAAHEAAVADIGRLALRGTTIATLCEEVARTAAAVLEIDLVAVLEQRSEALLTRAAAARRVTDAELDLPRSSRAWPLVGFALGTGEPTVVDEWRGERRFEPGVVEQLIGAASAVAVPVQGRRTSFGVLVCESEHARHFTPEDVSFLRALAAVLAASAERWRAEQAMVYAERHDRLTGLPNRALFIDLLRHTLSQDRRPRASLAVLLIDLDDFKLINTSLGHDAGDVLLREAVARFSESFRGVDTLARFTSDKFLVLCDDLQHERAAMRAAERILASLAHPFALAGDEITVTATVGIAIASEGDTAESLLRDAEAATRRAA